MNYEISIVSISANIHLLQQDRSDIVENISDK